ncbi:helix-turn-helix domain-containing protein [Natrinema ejinorense]|uniref:Transcriptional regulator n=1 Tax=Natrinema ejinorense TaxID=373386 RepID=A0A2A5QPD1_9EURY|nr:helix-turn-helix domain-containing protein [Natrinema ejinorense]PCR88669.1 transcriptional regulator [Natrinema ejinorense]
MPSDRFQHDSSSGDFSPQTSSGKILRVVRRLEPASTGEIADELEVHRNTARYRLKKLEDQRKVEKEEIGGAFVWRSN